MKRIANAQLSKCLPRRDKKIRTKRTELTDKLLYLVTDNCIAITRLNKNPMSTTAHLPKGAEWLLTPTESSTSFTPEEFLEEQLMVKDMCAEFLETEVLPLIDRIDKLEPGLMPALMDKAGALGLLGAVTPEEFGGLGKDFITGTLINEALGGAYSFSVAAAAHTGIGTLPILYFGSPQQKAKYIPKLSTGEWKGAYGLTEPNSGSDALSAKTTAQLNAEGTHYILNGQKCWITNGGFADIYTVFAKIDGKDFSAFIVERGMEGFTQGPEEHKMGIKGSSTVQLYFQDCKVPVENLLGEKGKGHIIAFNILNIGRLKLAAATLGGAKRTLNLALEYAKTREQFQQPIIQFGAIQHKIAQMAMRIWVLESSVYRTAKWIDEKEEALLKEGKPFNEAMLAAAEEYAIECAILKVDGSEVLDYVSDEAVQIFGGNGFSDEYLVSRTYRDSRINRIFEGTNEINRLLTVDMVLKRAMKGRLDLMGPAMKVQQELMSIPEFGAADDSPFSASLKLLAQFKKAIILVAGAAVQKLMKQLEAEQEVLMHIADMAILTFNAESALLRLMKLAQQKGDVVGTIEWEMTHIYLYEAADLIHKAGKEALSAFATGEELMMLMMGLKRFTKHPPFNAKSARRNITAMLREKGKYPL